MKREDHITRVISRNRLWHHQKGICVYCGKKVKAENASLDHIIPVNHIEENTNYGDSNLVMCCKRCNFQKHDYIVFSNLEDRIIYPLIDIPYFFRYGYITRNFKDNL